MADLDQLYEQLASGEATPPLQAHEVNMMLGRAERAARGDAVDDRMRGLRVAATIGGRDAWTVVGLYTRDPAVVVRRFAFELAVGAHQDGITVIREAAGDPDEKIAVEALRRLTIAVDKAATSRARALLASSSARVRAAAVVLLGHVAGPVVRREIGALTHDPDPEVRRHAALAIERIEGRFARRSPGVWWDAGAVAELETELAPTPQLTGPAPTIPTPTKPAAPPPVAPPQLTGPTPDLPVAQTPAVPNDAPRTSPAPSAPPIAPPPPAPPRHDAVATAAKPITSVEAAEMLRRFARSSADARGPLVEELQKTGELVLAAAQRLRLPGTDPDLGRGAAMAARYLNLQSWASSLRRMLSDPDAGVRAEAAETMGAIGRGMAVMTALAALLADRDPRVRTAAVFAVGTLGRTLSRPDLVRTRLTAVAHDSSEDVRNAREDVLKALI
jgi:HEAT repeat protein